MCSKNTTRCWQLSLTSFCVKNYPLPKFNDVLLKNAFCIKSAQRIQLAVENCFTSLWVKMVFFPNQKDILLKNPFCMKSAQSIQLAVENCVCLHVVLKTTFCQIISISCWKSRFSSKVLKEYNSLLKTVLDFIFC